MDNATVLFNLMLLMVGVPMLGFFLVFLPVAWQNHKTLKRLEARPTFFERIEQDREHNRKMRGK